MQVTGSAIAVKRITGRTINRGKPSSLSKRRCLAYKGIINNPQFFNYFITVRVFAKRSNGIATKNYQTILG